MIYISKKIRIFAADFRSVSSVGLERLLDRQEVTGSNPVQITQAPDNLLGAFLFSSIVNGFSYSKSWSFFGVIYLEIYNINWSSFTFGTK